MGEGNIYMDIGVRNGGRHEKGIFSGLGLDLVSLQQSDVDAMNGEYGVPQMFQTVGSFTCLAPVRVAGDVVAVRNVNVSARSYDDVQVQQ